VIRILTLCMIAAMAAACTVPVYEPDPVSGAQWQRRQEAIERQYAERERLCRITQDDDPRKDDLCRGVQRENH
jgi:hypothetical protein